MSGRGQSGRTIRNRHPMPPLCRYLSLFSLSSVAYDQIYHIGEGKSGYARAAGQCHNRLSPTSTMGSIAGNRDDTHLDVPGRLSGHSAGPNGSMACVDVCIAAVQMAPGLGPLSNRDLSSGEVRAGRHLWMTGSISVKGTLIDKYAFQKNSAP